jgi:hypothetical protein
MLNDLASWSGEVLLQAFAPAARQLAAGKTEDAQTLYQRFAFISAQLSNEQEFGAAIAQVLARPHQLWTTRAENRPAGAPLRMGSQLARQLTRPGASAPWRAAPPPLTTIPKELSFVRTEPAVDTPPNQFVRFALEHWRDLVAQLADAFNARTDSAVARRGRRESAAVLDRLDAILAEPLFREVSRLTTFPSSDQTLQKRDGYRQLLRLFLLTELAGSLELEGADDLFGAGSRDVATLYEYWCFLQLAEIVADVSGAELQRSTLLKVSGDRMTLGLRQGREVHLGGVAEISGRRLGVALFFNRTFGAGRGGSWTRQMRPDCSLLVRPLSHDQEFDPRSPADPEEVWLHFDAKYKVDRVVEQFGRLSEGKSAEAEAADDEQQENRGRSRREDLLKMHAYRDAIRRSAGAYVMYPGDVASSHALREYHEVLPGLGAFAFRPENGVQPQGAEPVRRFLHDVLHHLATQASQRERARFWHETSYGPDGATSAWQGAVDFLREPPADTDVLLGYVRAPQWPWVQRTGLYNVRADRGRRGAVSLEGRELGSDLVLLYNETGTLGLFRPGSREIASRQRLVELAYPEPGGELYVLFHVEEWIRDVEWPAWLKVTPLTALQRILDRAERARGAPTVATWGELAATAAGRSPTGVTRGSE